MKGPDHTDQQVNGVQDGAQGDAQDGVQNDALAVGHCLYEGQVVHQRHDRISHRLTYSVFSVLLDIDGLDKAHAISPLFSVNRRNLFSFMEADHMDQGHADLRAYVDALLSEVQGLDRPHRIMVLAYPRFLGHTFNPLTVFFCHDDADRLTAVLYQVSNTFGQRHHYLHRVDGADEVLNHSCDKNFYVSPFIEMDCTYHFTLRPPNAERVSILIRQFNQGGKVLTAAFKGRHVPLRTGKLIGLAFRYVQSGYKILAAIHWEALKLWLKGARLVHRPDPPSTPLTDMKNSRVTFGRDHP
ncbi:DUF1365 domain-containing protein [Coralliovum pocilloporae]|uniref:DUF1365 domain-containing protein n=1 Tax=Coralliovum pocilloporae TaxID=3066369 RepID=UPI003307BF64